MSKLVSFVVLITLSAVSAFADSAGLERERRELVHKELAQGAPAYIQTDFTTKEFSNEDRALVRILTREIAPTIEELYLIQKGALAYRKDVFKHGTEDDRKLFIRNQGPWCQATLTRDSPQCNAHPKFPKPSSDAYPAGIEQDAKMCETMAALPNGTELMKPFVVVRRTKSKVSGYGFVAVPLTKIYGGRMKKIAKALQKAAKIYPAGTEEPLREYLLAAAQAFKDNDWEKADEAWSRMNTENSRWYVRVGPDETYFDPCQQKAGFALTLARVSSGSAELKNQLYDLRQDLEQRVADLIGPTYQPRDIGMKTPEFVEMVFNAGDSRSPLGAVVGQTLPNWGKIAEEGRRNWNAINFYTDPASVANRSKRAKLFFVDRLLDVLNRAEDSTLEGTVIHEVTHNLGPDTSLLIDGKTSKERLGRLSGVLEEMKAQTGASWYLPFLQERGVLSSEKVLGLYVSNIFWCFNQISYSGMFVEGRPNAYGQLAAVQVAMLIEDGALVRVDTPAGWRFDIVEDKLAPSFERIMKTVSTIKALPGSPEEATEAAKKFMGHYIGLSQDAPGDGFDRALMDEIASRYRSIPKESFEYQVKLN